MKYGPLALDRPFRGESGITAIEYALIAALIAMVVIAGMIALGMNVQSLYEYIASKMPSVPGS